jgi:anti-anti-sigma factor
LLHQKEETLFGDLMLTINVDNLEDLTVIECIGRIVRDESIFKLRDVVLAQKGARNILLDLSEVQALGGAGVGMLAYLDHRARERKISFKLYSPSRAVTQALLETGTINIFEIVSFHKLQLMMSNDNHHSLAA